MRRNVRFLPAVVLATAAAVAPGIRAQDARDQPKADAAPPAAANANANAKPAQGQGPGQGQGQGQGQAGAALLAGDPAKLAELLGHWEKNSTRLKSLDVGITRRDKSPSLGGENFDVETYRGRAMLKSPNLAFLDFGQEVEVVDPKTKKKGTKVVPHERIICTGNEVWQYRNTTKQIFIYPLVKEEKQRALEEGPLPFLFNFRAGEALERYKMALVDENADFDVIQIIPKLNIDKESFTKAWVKLDRRFFLLPSRIVLLSPDGKSSKDFELHYTKESPNRAVNPDNFEGKVFPGWKVVRNPGGNPKPGAQPAPGPAGVDNPAPAAGARTPAAAAAAAPSQPPTARGQGLFGRRN